MRLVKQLDPCGCVPATIAMLTNKSYNSCKLLFSNKKQWKTRGTSLGQAKIVLQKLGFKVFERSNLGKSNALVVLNDDYLTNKIWNGMHAVVWDAKRKIFLDPMSNKISNRKFRSITETVLEVK